MVKETHGEDWPLWLSYDTEVQCQSVTVGHDPSLFHKKLFDDLYVRYTRQRITAQIQNQTNPSATTSAPWHPIISNHTPMWLIADPKVIPFGPPPLTRNSTTISVNASPVEACTPPGCVLHAHWLTEDPYFSQNPLLQIHHIPIVKASNTALVGTERMANAPSTSVLENMHALYAVKEHTMPKPAPLSSSFFPIITPFIALAWEQQLQQAGLFKEFSDVPYGIHHGFNLGIHSILDITYIPANHSLANQHPLEIMSYINNELSCSRYSGPFSPDCLEALIGLFWTSPLGVVPKQTPGEFCLVQDFSYPHNDPFYSSLNSEIDTTSLSCNWSTFQEIVAIFIDAPKDTQAATLDVDAAFWQCPIRPSQQLNFIIYFNGLCYISHIAPFGTASAGFVFGHVTDAMMAILQAHNIGLAKNWIDDFVFFCSLVILDHDSSSSSSISCTYSYDINTIDSIAWPLGWPWKHSKT